MLGGLDGGPLEARFRAAVEAAALDAAESALASGAVGRVVLVADHAPALPVPAGLTVDLDTAGQPFHFGARLAGVIEAHAVRRLIYMGGGSAPLYGPAQFDALGAAASADAPRCLANNAYSADVFALSDARVLARLDPAPERDNLVPRRLRDVCAVPLDALPFDLVTQYNLDSPLDLVALALAGRGGPRLREQLGGWASYGARLAVAARVLTDPAAEVLVAGRVGARTWQHLERETACRVRVLSEERGMTAAARDVSGEARSLLAMLLAAEGVERVFRERIPALGDAAFIDIRPACAHLGIHPDRADRFAADLGDAAAVSDPALRAIVEAAAASPVPVVLGAHSLVSGVLMLIAEWAWAERDARAGAAAAQ